MARGFTPKPMVGVFGKLLSKNPAIAALGEEPDMRNVRPRSISRRLRGLSGFTSLTALLVICGTASAFPQSVARQWDEELLNGIRHDLARPPVHARNLFHFGIAVWDGWAVYDGIALPYLTQERHLVSNTTDARNETISFAAYRILRQRFANSPGSVG